MGYFKLLNKIFPASPDQILKKATDAEAAIARMAHVNTIINDLSDIAHYELDVDVTLELSVNTNKGIIDVINWDSQVPDEDWGTSTVITLKNNPILNVANRDNLYIQITPYYSPAVDDNFIPYVLATGFTDGLNLTVWNANPATADTNNGAGSFYLYYEVKYIG
jgi:hypothetical protein